MAHFSNVVLWGCPTAYEQPTTQTTTTQIYEFNVCFVTRSQETKWWCQRGWEMGVWGMHFLEQPRRQDLLDVRQVQRGHITWRGHDQWPRQWGSGWKAVGHTFTSISTAPYWRRGSVQSHNPQVLSVTILLMGTTCWDPTKFELHSVSFKSNLRKF